MTVSGPAKLLYITIGILFLVLGIVGLIVPIIPGVLFLAGALYMLTRGSSRVQRIADENPTINGFQQKMGQFSAVSVVDRVRVTGWMMLQAVTSVMAKLVRGTRNLMA